MDSRSYQTLKRVYLEARALRGEERRSFLDRVCADTAGLREEVEHLLAQETELGSFLEEPAPRDLGASPEEPPAHPERIGAYRIQKVLGWGGMGVVYLAEQDSPRRSVALKVLRHDVASPARLARFEREAELLGRLNHPGIAQVYEAGWAETETGRRPFFAMEFVEGRSLLDCQKTLALREKLELARAIAEAMHYAHEHGVVHRDLKPSNVLIDRRGQPKVLDFGVARPLGDDSRATEPGQLVGTLAYMSPEQASGSKRIDAQSDVYSLGVILYELLSGRLPIATDALPLHEAVRAIREEDPIPAGSLRRELHGDLEIILTKALAKEPGGRYESAADLAEDLQLYLDHRPIRARAPSTAYVARKLVRRHRTLAGAMGALILALSAGLVSERVQRQRAEEALRKVEQFRRMADFRDQTRLLMVERERLKELSKSGKRMTRPGVDASQAELEDWLAEAWRSAGRLELHRQSLSDLERRNRAPPRERGPASPEEREFGLELQREIVRLLEELSRPELGLLARVQARLEEQRAAQREVVGSQAVSRP